MQPGGFGCRLLAAGAALAVAACGPPAKPYDQGYQDGCLTGYSDAGRPGYGATFVKNESRFSGDPEYQRGWIDGDKTCYQEEMRSPHMGGMS